MRTVGQVEALFLDFNGTLSDDEHVLATVYAELFADHGQLLPASEYLDRFAGMSDAEIFRLGLGESADVEALTEERIERYRERTGDGETITPDARRAVAEAAGRVPVVVVTSAFRREVEPALAGSGLAGAVSGIVSVDDVRYPKPHPEPYRAACRLAGVWSARAVAVEDTPTGIRSAQAAGVRCAAVTGTMARNRLSGAEELLDRLTPETVAALLER